MRKHKLKFFEKEYIGISDITGKKIRVGDLIPVIGDALGNYEYGVVVFNSSDFDNPCFCIQAAEEEFVPFHMPEDFTKVWYTVVSDIYKNPELIKFKVVSR